MTKFKLTEIEKIPGDWEVVRLGDNKIFQIRYGKAKPKEKGRIPVVGSSGIYDYTNKALVNPPVIVVGRKGTAGEAFLLKEPCWPSDTTFYITLISKVLDAGYLYFFLKWRRMSGEGAKTTLPSLRYDDLSNQHIPLPPFPEQQKIAIILSTVDEATQKTDDIIAKSQELKKGLMERLLTRGIGHTKFKQTEIGEIPEEWKIRRVKEICEKPQYGYTQSATDKPIGPKFLRITDIQNGEVKWDTVPFCRCPDDLIKKYLLKPGDILFVRTGATTGKSYVIEECPKAVFGSYLIRLGVKRREVDPFYLFVFFNSSTYWKQIRQSMVGSAQGGVNATILSSLKAPIPRLPEQRRIAEIIFSVDEKVKKERQRKEQLEKLKRGLVQDLLTGRARVKVN